MEVLMQVWLPMILAFAFAFIPPSELHGQSSPNSGLKGEITGVTVPANRRPVVTFKISDSKGRPLELEDLDPNSGGHVQYKRQKRPTGERLADE